MNTDEAGEHIDDLFSRLRHAAAGAAAHLQQHCCIRRKLAIFTRIFEYSYTFCIFEKKKSRLDCFRAFKANPLLLQLQTAAAAAAVY